MIDEINDGGVRLEWITGDQLSSGCDTLQTRYYMFAAMGYGVDGDGVRR